MDAHDVHVARRRRCGTSPPSSAGTSWRRRAWSSNARPPRRCSARWPPRRRAERLHNPGLEPARVDTVLADELRARRDDAPPPARRGRRSRRPPDGPPPIGARRNRRRSASMASGSCCARLAPGDFAEWSEVRRRNETLAAAVGAAPAAGAARPVAEPRGVRRSLPGARPRAPGRPRLRVRRVRRPPALRRGQPQPRRARRDAERHHRLLDRPGPRRTQPDRRGRRRRRRLRLRAARPASPRDLHRAAQPQQPAGDGEAGRPRGRDRRSATWRSTASWEDHVRYGLTVEEWAAAPRRAGERLAASYSPPSRIASALAPGEWPCGASTSSSSSAA